MQRTSVQRVVMGILFLLMAALMINGCGSVAPAGPTPGPTRGTAGEIAEADAVSTAAVQTVEAALRTESNPTRAATVAETPVPTLDVGALATAQTQLLNTAVAATLAARTPKPDPGAAETAQANTIATLLPAILTAQSTATPLPTPIPSDTQTATSTATSSATSTATPLPTPTSTATPLPMPTPAATATPTPATTGRGTVNTDQLRLRAGPDTVFDMVVMLHAEDELAVLGRSADRAWLRVRTADGQDGWVSAEFVSTTQPLEALAIAPSPPTPAACRIAVAGEVSSHWVRSELGCPSASARVVWSAYQPFERGFLLWRSDTDVAYVFTGDGNWRPLADRWNEGMSVPSRGNAPPGLQAPVRGFGYVWGTYEDIFQGLGWATDKEKGFCAWVQPFDRGFLLQSVGGGPCSGGLYNFTVEPGFGLAWIKAHDSGYWQR